MTEKVEFPFDKARNIIFCHMIILCIRHTDSERHSAVYSEAFKETDPSIHITDHVIVL